MSPKYWFVLVGQLLLSFALIGVWAFIPAGIPVSGPQLRAFSNEAGLRAFLDRSPPQRLYAPVPAEAAADAVAPAADANAAPMVLNSIEESPPATLITNVQTHGVDEGGIVKVHGRHLVVLRRGRLFTIEVGDGSLNSVDQIDAFPPSRDGSEAWYDEMLVTGNMVVVVGFNYGRSGTEINRFRISSEGQLTYRDTHVLRSNDYYSSENYASRLIGTTLVVYSPLMLQMGRTGMEALPALAEYDASTQRLGSFESIAAYSDIFVAPSDITDKSYVAEVAHSVSRCDLAAEELDCVSVVVLGGWSRSFYVSADNVYVWTQSIENDRDSVSARLYRIPLQEGTPSVVAVSGMPIDQFSFREDDADGVLNVLVQGDSSAGGDAMWDSEASGGKMRLLRLPLSRFASGSGSAEVGLYRDLPVAAGYGVQNRFVGAHLLYSSNERADFDERGIGRRRPPELYVVPLSGGEVRTLQPGHDVGRIDILGQDAVAIGNDAHEALVFSTVSLGAQPSVLNHFRMPRASESESRSQAFFFRPDADGSNGLIGLPIMKGVDRDSMAPNGEERGAILFVRRTNRDLAMAGELNANAQHGVDDNCHASCVDWYGNARPIFLGMRIFALMGYELVEGRMAGGRIAEVARVNFAPSPASTPSQ